MGRGMGQAVWLFVAALGLVACAKSESEQRAADAAANQGGNGGRNGAATGEAGRATSGSAGQVLPMICSDTATVRMAFPRLMSGAVWDLLVVEVRGAHLEVGIVNGNAVAGWSHENEQLPDGQHRSLYRLE